MARELHISSLVVHARPEAADAIRPAMARLPGIEIHGEANGKFVLTLETESEQTIVDHLNTISLLDGVLAATLVFHHVEELTEAE
ncbi:chaperone NapD [Azospirillum sp. TSO22-1]|uniref:chaperone NapD n=1 Tax=Azospirillum sp. TSO22-1 TaxID=716789 RepID=UPI000D608AA4|nr:chaperone NapD [Azospirillum sp. TSO22-1]PWC43070.1 hypothetical protein TSO221_20280 [Azospirillum sp. TSO22-1]